MSNFICNECQTEYISNDNTKPNGIRWADGHVCSPQPVVEE